MAQGEDGVVPGGDEFMGHKVMVADFLNRTHDRWIVDLLVIIQLATPWIARGVKVSDVVLVQAQAADDVTVHDAHMIDVKEQLEIWAADLLDQIHTEIHIIAEVAGVPFHGVRAVPGIQMLKHERDALFFRMRKDGFPGVEAVFDGFIAVHTVKFHAREGDHLLGTDICRHINPLGEFGDDLFAEFGVARAIAEAMPANEGDFEAELFHLGVVFPINALDPDEADVLGMFG